MRDLQYMLEFVVTLTANTGLVRENRPLTKIFLLRFIKTLLSVYYYVLSRCSSKLKKRQRCIQYIGFFVSFKPCGPDTHLLRVLAEMLSLRQLITQTLCLLGLHKKELINQSVSFGAGGSVKKFRCKYCGAMWTEMDKTDS